MGRALTLANRAQRPILLPQESPATMSHRPKPTKLDLGFATGSLTPVRNVPATFFAEITDYDMASDDYER